MRVGHYIDFELERMNAKDHWELALYDEAQRLAITLMPWWRRSYWRLRRWSRGLS